MNFVTERCEIARDRQASRAGTDQSYLFAVRLERALRHQRQRIVTIVGGDAFEAADRDGLFVDAAAAACGFARAVAVRPRIPGNTFESQLIMYASVYRPSAIRRMYSGTGVCAGTRVLAVHDLMEILGV